MPWYGYIIVAMANFIASAALTYAIGMGREVARIGKEVASLAQWQTDKQINCDRHQRWLEDTANIIGEIRETVAGNSAVLGEIKRAVGGDRKVQT